MKGIRRKGFVSGICHLVYYPLLLMLFSLIFVVSTQAEKPDDVPKPNEVLNVDPNTEYNQLPKTVKPTHYDLNITPDFENLSFMGKVVVFLDVLQNTDSLVLNSNELNITSVSVTYNRKATPILPKTIIEDYKKETIAIKLPFQLASKTSATLEIGFAGELNDKMVGFYRSEYTDSDGKKKYMASTQFGPTDARRAFPCWDEPALKATFAVTLNIDEELTGLSNMDVKSRRLYKNTGKFAVAFDTTPIMSTYIVAFAVGEFEYIEAYTNGSYSAQKVRCRVYTTPGQKEGGKFALSVTSKALDFFSSSFNIPYPLKKLDLIAVPDFGAGAMENWGLIAYRTAALLVDEVLSSTRAKQQVAITVGHEVAHQWFGNLATMEWWSDLWLNEGFATWAGYLVTDQLFPEWQIWTQFLLDMTSSALSMDAMRSSHPIQVPVQRAQEIMQIFDNISYAKGASIIRMLSGYMGDKKLLKGINIYLNRYKYKNASTKDLWSALSESSGANIEKFMTPWTQKVGYPLLTVDETPNEKSLVITQNRYFTYGNATAEEDKTLWWIPLLISNSLEPNVVSKDILSDRKSSVEIPKKASNSKQGWYKLNTGMTSLVRVKYTTSAIKNLSTAVNRGELELNDRIGMVSDAGALSYSGQIRTSDFLTILSAFKNETNLIVWQEIATRLETMTKTWSGESQQTIDKLNELIRGLFSPVLSRLGWNPQPREDMLNSRLRALAIRQLSFAKDQQVITEAKTRFNSYFINNDKSALSPDLRSSVFAISVYYGGEKEYNICKSSYLNTTLPMDQRIIALNALGSTEDPNLMQQTLDFVMSENVRSQDIFSGILLFSTHSKTRDLLWDWFTKSYSKIEEIFKGVPPALVSIIQICASEFSSFQKADEVKKFFSDKDTSFFSRALDQLFEEIKSKAAWLERDRGDVSSWLATNI